MTRFQAAMIFSVIAACVTWAALWPSIRPPTGQSAPSAKSMNESKPKIEVGKSVMRQMEPMVGTIIQYEFGGFQGEAWLVRWKDGREEWLGEETIRRMLLK